MAKKVTSLITKQRRKGLYLLLSYLFSVMVAVFLLFYLPVFPGIIIAPLAAFGIAWIMTQLVNKVVQAHCPVCDSMELTENFTLQCRLPEYQCARCQQLFVGGKIVEK